MERDDGDRDGIAVVEGESVEPKEKRRKGI